MSSRIAPAKARTSGVRLDIQGLRAIAVLAVVADHLMTWPRGGFVGVDVFFVISGYLITGQLIRVREKNPDISLVEYFGSFYRKRVKRILPAAVLVLVVTIGVGWALFRSDRAWTTTVDAIWAALFAGNWRFAVNGTDYWAQDQAVSPLQHFWSLGVEEQFYFIWPVVIVAVLAMTKAGTRASRQALTVAMVLIIALSLIWSIYETATNSTVAYFSTFSRAWELGVGALLAIVAPVFKHLGTTTRTVMAWVGVAGIIASVAFMSQEIAFPGPWALPPILATALVIAAGTGGEGRYLAPLTNPVMTTIGDLSYSLYLWHFPVIIFMEVFIEEWHWSYYPLVFGLMLLLSLASYHLVEDPVRRSTWLERKPATKPAWLKIDRPVQNAFLSVLLVCALGAVTATVAAPPSISGAQIAAAQARSAAAEAADEDPVDDSELADLQRDIVTAIAAPEWPELSPSIERVASVGAPSERADGCGEPTISDSTCNFQSGHDKTAVVFSDSTGVALVSTVRAALGDEYNVRGFAMAGCVSLDLTIEDPRDKLMAECKEFKAHAVETINAIEPDLVFITNSTGVIGDIVPGADELTGIEAWEAATRRTVEMLESSGAQIVLTTSAPVGRTISTCATKNGTPDDCLVTLSDNYDNQAEVATNVAGTTDAMALDTRMLFCDERGACPAFASGVPIKSDTVHVTGDYAQRIAPAFSELYETAIAEKAA